MSIIGLFRNYIEEHHPHLAEKEWIVDVRTVSTRILKIRMLRLLSLAKTQES